MKSNPLDQRRLIPDSPPPAPRSSSAPTKSAVATTAATSSATPAKSATERTSQKASGLRAALSSSAAAAFSSSSRRIVAARSTLASKAAIDRRCVSYTWCITRIWNQSCTMNHAICTMAAIVSPSPLPAGVNAPTCAAKARKCTANRTRAVRTRALCCCSSRRVASPSSRARNVRIVRSSCSVIANHSASVARSRPALKSLSATPAMPAGSAAPSSARSALAMS
mmetsp:Transcript_12253/g.38686  ORF Transcript_12253/g.38686 Transcript_12253/m.38686 type:complete len:224 (+) Transcript_12253:253-924(+)